MRLTEVQLLAEIQFIWQITGSVCQWKNPGLSGNRILEDGYICLEHGPFGIQEFR